MTERDAGILRAMPTPETINGKTVAQFWQDLDGQPGGP